MSLGIGRIWRLRHRRNAIPDLLPSTTTALAASRACPRSALSLRYGIQRWAHAPSTTPTSSKSWLICEDIRRRTTLKGYHDQPTATTAAPVANTPTGSVRARENHDRNFFYRKAFQVDGPLIQEGIQLQMNSPFVPDVWSYPSPKTTSQNLRHARYRARMQVGFDAIWTYHGIIKKPDFDTVYQTLKALSVSKGGERMAAMRVVLPSSWDLKLGPESVTYVDSETGLVAGVRVLPDHLDSHSVILRGDAATLARAVGELSKANPDIKVFKLGNVEAFDYEQQQLWPVIEGASEGGTSLSKDQIGGIWAHREQNTHWIETRYEDTPKPAAWTKENFNEYINTLVHGRLHSHLVAQFYAKGKEGFVDTDGVRIKLIMEAFEDPAAKSCITTPVIKTAMGFIMHKGGHRALGGRFFKLVERYGLPMDTNFCNMRLDGYVTKGDQYHFHRVLLQMKDRFFHANAGTWLLFLELVQKVEYRRRVIAAMYELGFLDDLATRRGIARVMASHDAYTAFRANLSLGAFMREQGQKYGADWLTNEARHKIVEELLGNQRPEQDHDRIEEAKQLIAMESSDGQQVSLKTLNHVITWCAAERNWVFALWALEHMHQNGLKPDHATYDSIIRLALKANSPSALGVALFHGIVECKIGSSTRKLLQNLFTGKHRHPFWEGRRIPFAPKQVLQPITNNRIKRYRDIFPRVQAAVLEEYGQTSFAKPLGAELRIAWRTMDHALHIQLRNKQMPDKAARPRAMVLKLKGPEGRLPARLNGYFDPKSMMEKWSRLSPATEPDLPDHDDDPLAETIDEYSQEDFVMFDTVPVEEEAEPTSPHGNNAPSNPDPHPTEAKEQPAQEPTKDVL